MYKLKNMVKRSSAFTLAVAMLAGVGASAVPSVAFADALNPLTERSLMLSSSSPGWAYSDGSGNTGTEFAPPGSGPNGLKTGETFSFRVSTDSTSLPIKAFTFQYCTSPAGDCIAPGNGTNAASHQSNLNVIYGSPVEGTDFEVWVANDTSDDQITDAGVAQSTGWAMTSSRKVTTPNSDTEKNFITLTKATGAAPASGYKIWVIFKASETQYITNPGASYFFVRLHTYSRDGATSGSVANDIDPLVSAYKIDGGVTVANMMNESIWITTKVLETMSFSVGTENPDTVAGSHGPCDSITVNDQIQLGESTAEYSLKVDKAFDAHSYWRLSTNSSAGASVYYSGPTLNNTVGDDIDEIGTTPAFAHYGMEQFGLALDTTADVLDGGAPAQTLNPLSAAPDYANGEGTIDEVDFNDNDALFAFTSDSLTTPELLASDNDDVTECATGKMRYIANIAPATPAGVYTTKINYIASPQY